jgi:hypothetical protein
MHKIEKPSGDYKTHAATCPLCQKLQFCQVAHDLLLKEAGYIPKKKLEEDKQ